jgi:hypothetical protein
VDTVIQLAHVLADRGTSDASVALGTHVVAESHHDLLDLLSQLTGRGKNQSLAIHQLGVDLRNFEKKYLVFKIMYKISAYFNNRSGTKTKLYWHT